MLVRVRDERTAAGAREELHRSLDRMGVDHVDLWQLHALADPIEWDTALSPGGALEAAVEARDQGLIRWIGVTGHGSQIAATHRRSLERFDFDSVLLPYNFVTMQNPYYAGNFDALYETCRERRVAVQTIKWIALRPWAGRPHTRATWYEPLEQQDDIDLAVWWAMGRPGVFLDSVGSVGPAPESARRGQPVRRGAGRRGDESAGRSDGGRAPVRLTGPSVTHTRIEETGGPGPA